MSLKENCKRLDYFFLVPLKHYIEIYLQNLRPVSGKRNWRIHYKEENLAQCNKQNTVNRIYFRSLAITYNWWDIGKHCQTV